MKRIAVAGLGKIGLFHLSILRNIPGVELAGLVDAVPAAQKTARGMGVKAPFFPSVDDLLSEEKVDGVFACVPPAFNPSMAQACIPKGVALFVEKPMAADWEGSKKMMTLLSARQSPPANAVGYMVGHSPIFVKAREILESGALGPIESYSASILLGEVFQKQEGWRQNPKISGGGAVAVLGSHLLYLVQSFLGMPQTIQARTTRLYSMVEDAADIEFFHEAFRGNLKISWSEPDCPDVAIKMDIQGSQEDLRIEENRLTILDKRGGPVQTLAPWDLPPEPCEGLAVRPAREGYASQDIAFVDSIGTGRENLVSWRAGFQVQRLIEGIYRSAAASAPLAVPE
jgi:predicted dehydrogenase